MKTSSLPGWFGVLGLCWFCSYNVLAEPKVTNAPVVNVTVELQVDSWSFWLMEDSRGHSIAGGKDHSIFRKPEIINCMVSPNGWTMTSDEGFVRDARVSYGFNGQRISEQVEIIGARSEADAERYANKLPLVGKTPPIGHNYDHEYATTDGNPGSPIGVRDLMTFKGRICWLAFCSGSALENAGRRLYPPSDIWKNLVPASAGFQDKTAVFEDELGLPRSVELFTEDHQTIFRYQVRETTNVMGWTFPTEFYAVQYRPTQTNGWQAHISVKGRVTAIGAGNPAPAKD